MTSHASRPIRRPNRLQGYDYASPGSYFITLVTFGRECIFGEVADGVVKLAVFGQIVQEEWLRSFEICREIIPSEFVVMPNHFHALVMFSASRTVEAQALAPLRGTQNSYTVRRPGSLATLVSGFKSAVTKRINELRDAPGHPVWQRNYFDRIVRNDTELEGIRRYIASNPAKQSEDPENPPANPLPRRVIARL